MWRIVQCAVQGRGHIKSQIPCQDKTYTCDSNGVSVIALADGAGSACLSHFGAECVSKYACEQFCSRFDEILNESDGLIVKKLLSLNY